MPGSESIQTFLSKKERSPSEILTGWLLLPLALVYRLAIAVRRALYAIGIFKAARLPVPVISIGGITAGGSGKTPVLMHVCDRLTATGKNVLILRLYLKFLPT